MTSKKVHEGGLVELVERIGFQLGLELAREYKQRMHLVAARQFGFSVGILLPGGVVDPNTFDMVRAVPRVSATGIEFDAVHESTFCMIR